MALDSLWSLSKYLSFYSHQKLVAKLQTLFQLKLLVEELHPV